MLPAPIRLENAVRNYLHAQRVGTVFANLPLLNSFGQAVGDDASEAKDQPPFPFLVIQAVTSADEEMPGVFTYTLTVTLHTDTAGTQQDRLDVLAIHEALHQTLLKAEDDDAAWSDENPEGGAFLLAANKPVSGTDARATEAKPLHVYDLQPQANTSELQQAEHSWNQALLYQGTAQVMDSHE